MEESASAGSQEICCANDRVGSKLQTPTAIRIGPAVFDLDSDSSAERGQHCALVARHHLECVESAQNASYVAFPICNDGQNSDTTNTAGVRYRSRLFGGPCNPQSGAVYELHSRDLRWNGKTRKYGVAKWKIDEIDDARDLLLSIGLKEDEFCVMGLKQKWQESLTSTVCEEMLYIAAKTDDIGIQAICALGHCRNKGSQYTDDLLRSPAEYAVLVAGRGDATCHSWHFDDDEEELKQSQNDCDAEPIVDGPDNIQFGRTANDRFDCNRSEVLFADYQINEEMMNKYCILSEEETDRVLYGNLQVAEHLTTLFQVQPHKCHWNGTGNRLWFRMPGGVIYGQSGWHLRPKYVLQSNESKAYKLRLKIQAAADIPIPRLVISNEVFMVTFRKKTNNARHRLKLFELFVGWSFGGGLQCHLPHPSQFEPHRVELHLFNHREWAKPFWTLPIEPHQKQQALDWCAERAEMTANGEGMRWLVEPELPTQILRDLMRKHSQKQ